ncbi:hypothetical protein BH10PSE14_BH10PSE14_07730 [soil metagenome]
MSGVRYAGMIRHTLFLAPLVLAACVAAPRPAPIAPAPTFDPIAFFDGTTEGHAVFDKILSHRHAVRVDGHGTVDDEGAVVLDQRVTVEGKPPKMRHWRIHRVSSNHYAGTLTDAPGGVTGVVSGDRLTLRFRLKGGYDVRQWLTLAPDRRSAHNIMVVRKLGITVAALDETIRKTS